MKQGPDLKIFGSAGIIRDAKKNLILTPNNRVMLWNEDYTSRMAADDQVLDSMKLYNARQSFSNITGVKKKLYNTYSEYKTALQ